MDMEQCHSELQDCNGKAKFFRLPGLLWLIAIPFGLVLLTATVIAPQSVPYDMLGPIGHLARLLAVKYPPVLKGIFYMTWILHTLEAVYAFKIARSKNLCAEHVWMWTIQTVFFGMFAMKYLLSYEPSKQKTT